MDQNEKEALKEEIISELETRLKGVVIREDTQNILSEPRNKWFTDKKTCNKGCPMYELFGSIVFWTVWEVIRKLTCLICGCGYVRQLKHREEANEIAERLCQTVYDLRVEFLEKRKAETDGNNQN